MMIEVDLTADQAMRPVGADREVLAKQMGATVLIGATNEDHLPAQGRMQVQFEVLGHRLSRRG